MGETQEKLLCGTARVLGWSCKPSLAVSSWGNQHHMEPPLSHWQKWEMRWLAQVLSEDSLISRAFYICVEPLPPCLSLLPSQSLCPVQEPKAGHISLFLLAVLWFTRACFKLVLSPSSPLLFNTSLLSNYTHTQSSWAYVGIMGEAR